MITKKVIIASIVVASLFTAGAGYLIITKSNEYPKHNYVYEFEIIDMRERSSNYSVIIPMPKFSEDLMQWGEKIIQDSNKEGNMDVTLVETIYGHGLLVNSSNRCKLSFNYSGFLPDNGLTMYNFDNNTHGCYLFADFPASSGDFTGLAVLIYYRDYYLENAETPWVGGANFYYSINAYPLSFGWEKYGLVSH